MPTYALIDETLAIAELRDIADPASIPAHKTRSDGGLFLRPIDDPGPPSSDPVLDRVSRTLEVHPDRVAVVYTVSRIAREAQIQAVKEEAQRRIYERFPQWKQANMTARAVELVRLGEANWSPAEQSEAQALDAGWAWIKSVRAASNSIEALDPIPSDYAADARWP